jgi:MATE family multidrug resistance protein
MTSRRLTWTDSPLRELSRLAWPMCVSMLSWSVMTLVDTLFIGHIGTAELAGVGLAGTSTFVLLCFSFGLLQGAKTLVSQAIGAGRRDKVAGYVGASIAVALCIGFVTAVLAQIVARLIPALAASEAAGNAARTYMSIRSLGAPIVLAQVAMRETLQARGNARAPMVATVIANLVNTALAATLIFVFRMGVAGAAVAALISACVEAAIVLVVQRRYGLGLSAFGRPHVAELFRMGLPTGLQFLLEIGSFATLTVAISTFSVLDMAAHQIALQVIHFSFLPPASMGEAAAVLTGQAVGAGRDDLVRKVARLAGGVGVAYAGVCSALFVVLGGTIASGFTTDTAVVTVVHRLLLVAGIFQVFDAANVVSRCVLRGAGDVRFPAVVGVITAWLSTPTLAWGLGHGLGLGALGGWIGLTVEIVVGAAILAMRVERRGWARAAHASRARLGPSLELEPARS